MMQTVMDYGQTATSLIYTVKGCPPNAHRFHSAAMYSHYSSTDIWKKKKLEAFNIFWIKFLALKNALICFSSLYSF